MANTDVIADISRVYVDSNIFIYYLEDQGELGQLAVSAIEQLLASGTTLVTSELSLTECLFGARKSGGHDLAELYVRLLTDPNIVRLVPAVQPILVDAADVGAATGLKIIDAIHFATALATECGTFLTNDSRLRSISNLDVIHLRKV